MGYRIVVDKNLCKGCGICVTICPHGAIVLSRNLSERGYRYPVPTEKKCMGCRLCEVFCPDFAITITEEGEENG
ncbi:4Fe-4S binding protein [Desulfurococcaceae archaeon MEX13E-LK6-19]|nr:4Fe-4S binding protein [Desulfurococcaceae archaeon MEX13E-LK6-19]